MEADVTEQELNRRAELIAAAYKNLSGVSDQEFSFNTNPAPHSSGTLLEGKMAVYCFLSEYCCLKVGKAGPKSKARYNSNHYGVYKKSSTLAKSIISEKAKLKSIIPPDKHDEIDLLDEKTIGTWLKEKTNRINFLIDSSKPIKYLNLLEAIAQFYLEPIYEGRKQQL